MCLAYTIYVFNEWLEGKILPKVSNQLKTIQSANVKFDDDFLQLGFYNNPNPEINPFSSQNNILLPLLIRMVDDGLDTPIPLFSNSMERVTFSDQEQYVINLKSITLQLQEDFDENGEVLTSNGNEVQYFFLLTRCDAKYLSIGQSCATEAVIDQYLNYMPFAIALTIKLKQYNIHRGAYDTIAKTTFQILEKATVLYSQILFGTTEQTIDSGILINKPDTRTFVTNYELINQTIQKDYILNAFGFNAFSFMFLRLDNSQNEETIVVPKLGEVLAQIGSILSLLMMLRFVVLFLNQKLLIHDITTEVIQFYQSGRLIVQRNLLGQVKSVNMGKQSIAIKQYTDYYSRVKMFTQQKLHQTSLIKEIMRMQIILLHLCDKDKISDILKKSIAISKLHNAKIYPSPSSSELSDEQDLEGQNQLEYQSEQQLNYLEQMNVFCD